MTAPTTGAAQDTADRVRRLEKINRALMRRVEISTDVTANGFSLFQTAILLEGQVRARTDDLEHTLTDLSEAYTRLRQARDEAETAKSNLTAAIEAVSEGFALFDDQEALVLCNQPFRGLMPDVGPELKPGTPFARVAQLFSQSRYIHHDGATDPKDWSAQRVDMFRRPHASFVQQVSGDRWIQVSNKKTGAGATVIFQTDITDLVRREREHRERQLDQQSRTLQATLDYLPQGICMVSPDFALKAWNYQFVSLLALPVRLVQPLASFEAILTHARQHALVTALPECGRIALWLHETGQRRTLNLELTRSDGVVLDVSCNQMPDGGMVASFTDVTAARQASEGLREAKDTLKQKVDERTSELQSANLLLSREIRDRLDIESELIRARDAAEEADRSKTRFLAAASHDLLQPLNAARIFLSLLSDMTLDPQQNRLALKVHDAFGSAEQLLGTLLDISRYDSGAVEIERSAFALDQMLTKLVAEFQPMAEQKSLTLTLVRSGLTLKSDVRHLRRVVQNLIANAVRYTRRGRIIVGARRSGANALIQVWDTGPGIPKEQQVAIFEEFRRLNNDGPNEPKGMGLGLAIVNRIARLLDHPVQVHSMVGRGSCFSVCVPQTQELPKVIWADAAPAPVATAITGKTALLLENDLPILEGMVALLERWKMTAIPTVSLQEAFDSLDTLQHIPDVILADFHLDNNETGIEAILALRTTAGKVIPAVLITADRTQELRQSAARNNISVLHKPIRSVDLALAISKALL